MRHNWLEENTFHYSKFSDLYQLVEEKQKKNLKISLCLPTLNEEKTIAKEIIIMKSELMLRYPLLDEIIVIVSGSTDNTLKVAKAYGADVYEADTILSRLESYKGKGENLWKALYVTKGDIIVYLDADIKNIHHRFAYGLLGPLLFYDHIKYSKAFFMSPPQYLRFAAERLIILPAPCAVEPKVSSMAFSAPTKTQELVPILPGISTGCPSAR